MQARRLTAIVLSATMVAAAAGWFAGSRIRSPAQIAAETAPPTASLITVAAERATLSTDVVVRGTVRHGTPQVVVLATSALKSPDLIVTSPPERGATLDEGTVPMTLSGRPVFVLSGEQPAYRDLSVGVKGPDVSQLQKALARLGFDPGRTDGVFDAATATAMARLYTSAGWAPFGLTDDQVQALRAAHEAAAAAQDRRLAARLALDAARTPSPGDLGAALADLAGYEDAAAAADAALEEATAAQQTAHQAIVAAQDADAAARAEQRRDDLLAAAELTNKSNALQAAIDNEAVARLRLAEGEAIDPASGEPSATPAELAALRAELSAATAAVADARAGVDAARAGVDAARAAGTAAGSKAVADLEQARREASLADAGVTRAAKALASAQERLRFAQARIDAVRHPTSTSVLEEALALAAREAERTAAELALLTRSWSFQVPADELLFLPVVPARVDEVKVTRGQVFAGEAMTVSGFRLAVDSALSLTDATLVTPGLPVTIEEPDLGITVTGVVTEVGDRPGTKGTDQQHVYLEVTPDEAPDQLLGASVKLTIAVRSTGSDVLAVPVSALFVTVKGTSRVQVLDGDSTRTVTVRPGLSAQGLVEVTPVDGSLTAGDRVVVGDRSGKAGTAAPSTNGATERGR
jgi:multidrug efflux pump subunit AcrA (membrane-fusion protein)